MKKILTLLVVLIPFSSYSQNAFTELEKKYNFKSVIDFRNMPGMEDIIWPKYIDGKPGLDKFIEQTIKYPELAINEKIEGIVVLSYSINSKGNITDIAVSSGSDHHTILQDELIRVLKKSGPCIPGKKGDKFTKMKLSVSYEFKLK